MLLPLRGRSWVADAAADAYVYVLCFSCHVSQPMLRTEVILPTHRRRRWLWLFTVG
jgi:hypothetical protein